MKIVYFTTFSFNLAKHKTDVFMIQEIIIKLKRFFYYHKAIEGFGVYICALNDLLRNEIVRIINIGGNSIYIRTNTPDLSVAISSLFEKEYDNIRSLNPKFIIDAGANIGTSAMFFAKKYPNAQIIAIEPEESNFNLLLKNTNNYDNIVAVNAAIWGIDGKRTVQNRFTGHWGYTVSETHNETESTGQEINCITVESIMNEYGIENIDIFKMDIEGAEKNVLENSSNWIDSVAIMTVELHDRICMGCARAFYLSTKDFRDFEKHGEKVTAYRD